MKSRHVRKRADDATSIWQNDNLEIMVNPTGDRNVFYHFLVNSAGTLTDICHEGGRRRGGSDVTWNAGATANVTRGAASWTAEL